ncbi:MAG: phosphoribosylaminoimidazolesuccinocarboxamide synthase [Parcubacteria group bacterium]
MEKKKELYRGKTKAIYATDDENLVVLENFDDITKFDNPDLTKKLSGKAKQATKTTCNVFSLLKEAKIPVAFEKQLSETEFLAPKCKMIPLEVIARRYAVGSYLKRFPHLKKEEAQSPHRFHSLKFELFLKTTNGIIKSFKDEELGKVSVDDPLTKDDDNSWKLMHPKKPEWEEGADLDIEIHQDDILSTGVTVDTIFDITLKTFLVLESAWSQQGCRLIDFKIEFGINTDGKLMVADVIDNDSWRLRTSNWEELSKENFRQNMKLDDVSSKYDLVAKLSEKFHLPKQAIVFWRGSESDPLPLGMIKEHESLVHFKDIGISGHKSPKKAIEKLEKIMAAYPEGGVIIPIVGMSNGLGPMLAARTSWPVIAVPATAKEVPEDVWSSLRLPSKVPMMTVLSASNATLAAFNILALKNPAIYAEMQKRIEKLDK